MKTLILAIICAIIVGTVTTGCDSDRRKILNEEKKEKEAEKELATIRKDLRDEAHKLQIQMELNRYKADCELVILSNQMQIANLENDIIKNNEANNDAHYARINELKIENELLIKRIKDYEIVSYVSMWEEFKTEINRDMKAIADAFKDLTINSAN